jgi:hypothetical protein
MPDEGAMLEEAMDNLNEAAQRVRATQARMRSLNLSDHPEYKELSTRLSVALACVEAAYLEARRRTDQSSNR